MAYMSYCRHEGTLSELRACLQDACDHINEEAEYEVSDREIRCFKTMVVEFHQFLMDTGLLDEDGYIDDNELQKVCDAMSKSYDESEEWGG